MYSYLYSRLRDGNGCAVRTSFSSAKCKYIKHEVLIEDAVFHTLLWGRGRGSGAVNTSIFGSERPRFKPCRRVVCLHRKLCFPMLSSTRFTNGRKVPFIWLGYRHGFLALSFSRLRRSKKSTCGQVYTNGYWRQTAWVNLRWTNIPSRGSRNTPWCFMPQKQG